jgi:CRP-like cAMP-binding protein
MELPPILKGLTVGENAPSPQMFSEYLSRLETKTFRSKTTLLHVGDLADTIYFVIDGCIATTYKDDQEDTHIAYFIGPNEGVTSIDSFLFRTPSTRGMITTTTTKVLIFTREDWQYLNKLYPGIEGNMYRTFIKLIAQQLSIRNSLIPMNATDRYQTYLDQFESLEDRIPLNFVSSYLGVRQQSLSRIRARLKSA